MNKKIVAIVAIVLVALILLGGILFLNKDTERNDILEGKKNEFIYSGDFGIKIENIKVENNILTFDTVYKVPEESFKDKKINVEPSRVDSTILFVTENKIFEAAHSMGVTVNEDSYLNVVAKDNFGKNYRENVIEVESKKVSSKKIDKDTYTASYSCKLNENLDITNAKIMVRGFEVIDKEFGKYMNDQNLRDKYILDEYVNLEFMFK